MAKSSTVKRASKSKAKAKKKSKAKVTKKKSAAKAGSKKKAATAKRGRPKGATAASRNVRMASGVRMADGGETMAPVAVEKSHDVNTSLKELVAYVSVRSQGGKSLFAADAEVKHDNVSEFRSTPQDTRRAVAKLTDMGFRVDRVTPMSVRLRGDEKLFHKHMGLKFEKREASMYVPTEKTVANCMDLSSEVMEGLAFPQPLQLHGKKKAARGRGGRRAATHAATLSATSPSLNYFHLNVPKDIVKALNAGSVHASGVKGQNVRAAMIDSGFQWSHPYFQGKGYDLEVALPAGSDDDDSGHGTGESANFLAIAPKAKLYGLNMDDAVNAFQVARDDLGVRIVSNSWGSAVDTDGQFSSWDNYWKVLLAEIALCTAAGMIVLFSGGNGGMSVTASSPDVISVGGVYQDANGQLFASDYASSFKSTRFPGRQVPFVCGLCGLLPRAIYISLPVPKGCEIDRGLGGGSFPNGDETGKQDGWAAFSGTSAACPMVAGVVALILSKYPQENLAQIRARLSDAVDVTQGQSAMGDAAVVGGDLATGFGFVDAAKACV
jgi:hypothetical protein